MNQLKPEDYHGIALWGQSLQSMRYYIQGEMEKAAADGAPADAIYKAQDGSWNTVDMLHNGHPFKDVYANFLFKLKHNAAEPYYKHGAE